MKSVFSFYTGIVFSFITIMLFTNCTTKKEIVPTTLGIIEKNFQTDLVINYKLDKTGIQDTFNNAISEALRGNFDIPEYDIKMILSKPSTATVEITGKDILVKVPIGLYLEKKTFLTTLSAHGVLQMSFISNIDIDSIWNLSTKTILSEYKWVNRPQLTIAGVNIPIQTIANAAIKQSKQYIETAIDQSIKENLTLKDKMAENMKIFKEPFRIDTSMNGWLSIKPQAFRINKVNNQQFAAYGKIEVKGTSTFTTYKPPVQQSVPSLPKVFWSEHIPDSSIFRIVADIKTFDINPFIKANLEGKTFTEGGKSITLSNIVTNCDYQYFKVTTDVAGTINGTLLIKGKPQYDARKNEFYMDNIDIELRTKNVIHKAAAWIGEGKIRKELESMLKFPINSYLSNAQKNIDVFLKDFYTAYGIALRVGIGRIDLESFELQPGVINAVLRSKLYLEVGISDFRSFNKF